MRMHIRVGLGTGALGFLLLYAAQVGSGLGAIALLGLIGLLAGLAMAKWLPRDWYGRQLAAGARAGGIACGLAGLGLLVSLGYSGKHAIPALARQSHLLGLNVGPAVSTLGGLGWFGSGLLLTLVAVGLATAFAAVVTGIAAWDKSRRAIDIVNRAREAARRTNPALSGPRPSVRPSVAQDGGSARGQTKGRAKTLAAARSEREARTATRRSPAAQRQPEPPPKPIVPPGLPPDTGAIRAALSAWKDTNRVPKDQQPQPYPLPQSTYDEDDERPQRDPEHDNWLC